MVSSVGRDVRTSCASIRAGIMRASEISHFSTTDADTHESIPIAGCAVSPVTDGFGSVARWSILGQQAISDMITYGDLPFEDAEFWKKTAVIFALPSLDEANFDFEGVIDSDNANSVFVAPFISQSGLSIPLKQCTLVSEDDTAVISACQKVEAVLAHDSIDRAIVLALDSLIDGHRLQWLDMQERVKTPDNPVGLMPGEAAAALLFESESAIAARGAKPLARVYSYGVAQEPNHFMTEEPNTGEGLTSSIKQALSAVNLTEPYTGVVMSDLNGEEWRAIEYSVARLNLTNKLLSQTISEVFPAASIGDVGVATPACALCMLIESQQRKYAISQDAIILASSTLGKTAGMLARAY